MSKQIRFFATQHDLHLFLDFAEGEGFFVLPEIYESDEIPKPILPTQFEMKENDYFFYLMHKVFSAVEAFYTDLPDQSGLAKLMARASPAIEVSPSSLDNNRLEEGRIYFDCDSSDPRYEKALGTYKTLEQFLRKWTRTPDKKFVVGPNAFQEAEQGRISLVPR